MSFFLLSERCWVIALTVLYAMRESVIEIDLCTSVPTNLCEKVLFGFLGPFSPFPFCVAQTKKINTKKFWPTLAKNVVTLNVTETRSYIQTSMYLHPCIYIGTFIHLCIYVGTFIHLWTYVGTFIHLYMNVPTFLHIRTNVNVRTFWVIVYYPLQLLAQIKYRYFWCFWSFRFQSFDQPFPIKPIDRKIVKPVWQVCWSDSLIIILSDCLIITAKPS